MEQTDAVLSEHDTAKPDEQEETTMLETDTDVNEDRLKFAPIHGPTVTSPQQYIPEGYCLLACDECGGVDGMQININICVYCADKLAMKASGNGPGKTEQPKTRQLNGS